MTLACYSALEIVGVIIIIIIISGFGEMGFGETGFSETRGHQINTLTYGNASNN